MVTVGVNVVSVIAVILVVIVVTGVNKVNSEVFYFDWVFDKRELKQLLDSTSQKVAARAAIVSRAFSLESILGSILC